MAFVDTKLDILSLNPMNDGWIKLHRSLLEHWVWQDPVAFRLWSYLLFKANYAPTKRLVDGKVRVIDRGDILTSYATICEQTGIGIKTIRNVITALEADGMVARQRARRATHLTICNYDTYQDGGDVKGISKESQRNLKGQHNKKERKEERDNTPLTPLKGGDVAKPRRRDQRWHEYRWYLEQRQKGVDNDRMEMRVVDGKAQYRMKS